MKTVLTSIITSIITVAIALFVVYAIVGDGECMLSHEKGHDIECKEHVKKVCDSKKDADYMMMRHLAPAREKFETMLSDDEIATIASVREKFADVDHEKMCDEGKKKFYEQHKEDFDALNAIAENHKEFLEGIHHKMHMTAQGHEGEVIKHTCPEAQKCKEATEKCKGELNKAEAEEKDPEAEKECKEAEEECKAECMQNFKIHFILMEYECDHDEDEEHEHAEGDED